ncbi:MAG: LacI family DNA-binding transcriptional regulator [Chloroflexota bacterium]
MCATAASRKATTLRDVARRAGVSTATVSRALRSAVGTDPATRRRVQEAARALHYRPSGVARSLKLRSTTTIGLIVTDIENPYFPQVIRAVEDAARDRGYSVVLTDGRRDPEREIRSLEVLAQRGVDGLIIASSALTERHRHWIEERPCPVVIVNGESPVESVPAVLAHNEAGGRLAAEHLLDLGHRHIGYVAAPASDNVAVSKRLGGAYLALADRGLAADDLHVVVGDGRVGGGEEAGKNALQRWPGITALICYNDLTAVGATRGLRSLGLSVPHDVSVVGFDDIDLAPYVDPALTTIRQNTDEMGHWAVEALVNAMEASSGEAASSAAGTTPSVRRIPVRLIVRESTAASPGGSEEHR